MHAISNLLIFFGVIIAVILLQRPDPKLSNVESWFWKATNIEGTAGVS